MYQKMINILTVLLFYANFLVTKFFRMWLRFTERYQKMTK